MTPSASETATDARAIFHDAVQSARPDEAVRRALTAARGIAQTPLREPGGCTTRLERQERGQLYAVAVGKAACSMASAAEALLPRPRFRNDGIVAVNPENERPVRGFTVFRAGHPLPDSGGERAATAIEEYVRPAGAEDTLLVLLSGGGSAILPAPVEGVTLAEKVATTDLLLASGAGIREINTVRKHLSRLKGGGLARVAFPAEVLTLIVSDVIGDDLSSIASGPTAPDPTTFADATGILQRYALWDRVPESVRQRFRRGTRGEVPDTPNAEDEIFRNVSHHIIGSNRLSVEAAHRSAAHRGYAATTLSMTVMGEAREAGSELARSAASCVERESQTPLALLWGGETTVTLRGDGRGGRNQELALAFLLEAETHEALWNAAGSWTFLSGGTDGIDGPTDAAGAVVERTTLEHARNDGIDPEALLDRNDSYAFHAACGSHIQCGATGTNVADLQAFLYRPT